MDKAKISMLQECLDLNLYEAKVYLALVLGGKLRPSELYSKAEIPQSRTYDIVSSLEKKNLVTRLADSAIKAVPPEVSIPAHLDDLLSELEAAKSKRIREFQNELKAFYDESIHRLSHKRKIAYELIEALESVIRKVDEQYPLLNEIKDEHNLVTTLVSLIQNSKRVIRHCNAPPNLPISSIWESLVLAMKKGIRYEHIAPIELIFEWGIWRISKDIESAVNFRFLPQNVINRKFYVFDDQRVLTFHKNASAKQFVFEATVSSSNDIIEIYNEIWTDMWSKSIEFKSITSSVAQAQRVLSEKLDSDEKSVLDKILKRGKYADVFDGSDIQHSKVMDALESLKKKGFLAELEESKCGYIANHEKFVKVTKSSQIRQISEDYYSIEPTNEKLMLPEGGRRK